MKLVGERCEVGGVSMDRIDGRNDSGALGYESENPRIQSLKRNIFTTQYRFDVPLAKPMTSTSFRWCSLRGRHHGRLQSQCLVSVPIKYISIRF